MTLDDCLKLTQIGFYLVVGTLGVLTYMKAKNGLLDPVNTEYKKRVMDRLAEVSRDLLSEFDSSSPNHWAKKESVREVVTQLHDDLVPCKKEVLERGEHVGGIPVSEEQQALWRMTEILKSDPFMPRDLRQTVAEFFEERASVMAGVFREEIGQYAAALAKGEHWDTLETNHLWINNQIVAKLKQRGFGVAQVEKRIHEMRDKIQRCFEAQR